MTVLLKDLFIGKADGEIESQEESFKDMFYNESRHFEEITNDWSKFIVAGPKGSGKTILGRYSRKIYQEKGIDCEILKSNSITLNKLINIGRSNLESQEISIFYKWFILLEFSKIIKKSKLEYKDIEPSFFERIKPKNKKKYEEYSQAYDSLFRLFEERFPKGNYESSSFNTLEQINALLSAELSVNPIKEFTSKCKSDYQETSKQEKTHELKPYFKVINEFEENLLICMKYHHVVLILDDIDEMKVNLEDDVESRIFLESLILTLKELNSKMKEYNLLPSKCILLLRSDILRTLNKYSSNLNKILADSKVELYWQDRDNDHPEDQAIIDMIFHKIKVSCPEYRELSNKELYKTIFPKRIDNKTATNYLLDFSLGRPRDVVFYLGCIQRRFKSHTYFAPTSFVRCENEYSNLLKDELINEFSLHFDSKYVDDLMKLISDFKQPSFYYKDIKRYYEKSHDEYENIKDIKIAISDLYNFGVLGNSWKNTNENTKDGEYGFSWAYRRDGNKNVDYNQKLSVHYGLRSSLNLKKNKSHKKIVKNK